MYKPGSPGTAATLGLTDFTDGLGANVSLAANGFGIVNQVNYADGGTGTAVGVVGWTAPSGLSNGILGVQNQEGTYRAFINQFDPSFSNNQITQTLSDSLLPNTQYVLTADVQPWINAGLPLLTPITLGLEVSGQMLAPTASSSGSAPLSSRGPPCRRGRSPWSFRRGPTRPASTGRKRRISPTSA